MAEHPNAALLRRFVDGLAGDTAALNDVLADGIVWHLPGKSQIAGDYQGRAAFFGLFAKVMELSDGTFAPTVHDILASDDHAVLLTRDTASRDGRTLAVGAALIFHIRDGKLAECWDLNSNPQAWDAFWA